MSESKHTQGRCKVVTENKPFLEIDTPGAMVTIAEVYNNTDYVDLRTGAFNAERLAKCWNSHDAQEEKIAALLDACKSYGEVFDESTLKILEATLGEKFMVWLQGILNEVQAAIEMAEKGT